MKNRNSIVGEDDEGDEDKLKAVCVAEYRIRLV
jgi:hypothetical protein